MDKDTVVLCGASAYNKKYYLNKDFDRLPKNIKDELKAMCVLFTEEVGGVLTLCFEKDGTLLFETRCEDGDVLYDDIGSRLEIGRLRREKAELFRGLTVFYKIFLLGEAEECF